ncbi:MAG: type II secretion system protein N [Burkholderiaceae bacterium]|jgi:general secretion pathway protein N
MFAKLATFLVGLVVFVTVVAIFLPANWLARLVVWRSNGAVLLADAQGSVWRGDAVLGVAANGVSRALPGRVGWTTHWIFPTGLAIELNDAEVFLRPITVRIEPQSVQIDSGDAQLPLALAILAGAPLNSVRPNGQLRLHWDALSDRDGALVGNGYVQIQGLWVEINPVRPLGDYQVTWQYGAQGLTWTLATENGPLQLDAQGSGLDRAHFSGRAAVAKGVPEATAQRLWPLLEALGPRQGDNVQINIGAY